VRELERAPLVVAQALEGFPDRDRLLRLRRMAGIGRGLSGLLAARRAAPQPIEGPRPRDRADPGLGRPPARIESPGLPPDLQEDLLHHVFRFRAVAQDAEGETGDEARAAVVHLAQGHVIAGAEPAQERFDRGSRHRQIEGPGERRHISPRSGTVPLLSSSKYEPWMGLDGPSAEAGRDVSARMATLP